MNRTAARLLTALLSFVALFAIAGAGSASAETARWAYKNGTVTEFSLTSGQQQWAGPSKERLTRTSFVFEEDGTLTINQPDGYARLTGTWTKSSDGVAKISASNTSTVGSTGYNSSSIDGVATFTGDSVRLSFTSTTGSSTAAVVNGTSFGSSASKVFHATVEAQKF